VYVKLFASLYQGTLRGRSHPILVFTNLLANADQYGHVDKHWAAIAGEVGLTVDEVKEAIKELEAPDPESRTQDEEGRRIVPMDEHRAWGWRIVNYGKYRQIRNEDDRREQNRQAQERYRNKNKPASAIVSQGKPRSAQAEAEAEAEAKASRSKPTRAVRAAGDFKIPDWLNAEDWNAYKTSRGSKYTEAAQELAMRQLESWRQQGQDPNAILRQSVMQGWKGLFELKGGRSQPDKNAVADAARKMVFQGAI
jgi:hypothetical protein